MSQSNSNNQRNNRNSSNNNRSNNSNNRNRNGKGNYNRNRRPKQKPLTWWQKFLKALGLLPSAKKQTKKPANKTSKPQARKPRPKTDDSNATYSKTRLYIGNLSYEVNDYDLEELFKGVGNLKSAQVAYNRHTQKSRGYGFVEFLNPADSTKAIAVLHEQYFMGRKLLVSAAREKENVERGSQAAS